MGGVPQLRYALNPTIKCRMYRFLGGGRGGGLELSEGEECLLLSGRKIDLE